MKIFHFYHIDSDLRFPPFLLYARWKSGVTFVRRCFLDANRPLLSLRLFRILEVWQKLMHSLNEVHKAKHWFSLNKAFSIVDTIVHILFNLFDPAG